MTLVMLAIGRSVSAARSHSTCPVLASARIAPLAFTLPGAPVTWIFGLARECSGDGPLVLGLVGEPDGLGLLAGSAVAGDRSPAGCEICSLAVAPPAARVAAGQGASGR